MRKFGLAILLVSLAWAQKKPITLESLRDLNNGPQPSAPVWAPDGKAFAFRQGPNLMLYTVAARSSKMLVTTGELDEAAAPLTATAYTWTNRNARSGDLQWFPDSKALLVVAGGDLFLIRASNGVWEQLTHTPEAEADPKISPDGKKILFERDWDLYILEVASREETRLTTGGSARLRNGGLDWVYPEEIGLNTASWWSPDSRSVAYLQFDISGEPLAPHADLSSVRAVFEPQPYPQPGENNASLHLGVVAATGGSTHWLNIGDTRDSFLIARAGWMPGSHGLWVVRTNRVQTRLEALAIDVESGKTTTLFHEADPYWINLRGSLRFLPGGRHFLRISERDGHQHLYLYSLDGEEPKQLTRGDWEVNAIVGRPQNGHVFYTSNQGNRFERQLFSVELDGGSPRQLTTEPGTHNISMAPSGAYYLDTYSSLTTPPRAVLRTIDGKEWSVYREIDRHAQQEFEILPTEIVEFRGPSGDMLAARLIKPAGFQPGKKYPVIVDTYGGPGVDLPVHNAWPGAGIDQVLAQHGYIVWQAENRGGMGRGHAFETAIYHKLGAAELADQVAGVRYLISLGFADPHRIGIRGWSYGGFMTVNALLNAPDVFQAGFAGAPVTNWLNYDAIYTERYMGLPDENREGYQETALPAKAAQLTGKLMLVHNLEDDNVLFQNTLQLTSALEAAGKPFEMMIYPQKSHQVSGRLAQQLNQLMLDFFDRALR